MKQAKTLSKVLGSALVVRLEFDGSLRPPKDFGFPTIPAKLATCSASLSIAQDLSQDFEFVSPCALGCRWLKSNLGLTSAYAEYGGLLLGLEFLNELDSITDLLSPETVGTGKCSLLIVGDCKTVIDQINGKSVPRRMEIMHKRVIDILSQMGNKFASVDARHIPRKENILCDSICGNLMNVIEWREVKGCRTRILGSRHEETRISAADIFARYLKDENKCIIPYSKRQDLYQSIASLGRRMDDFETLIEVGTRRLKESVLTENKYMEIEGIRNQIDGWRGLGDAKKVDYLTRKHRYLLATQEDRLYCDVTPDAARHLGGTPVEWKMEFLNSCQYRDLLEAFGSNVMSKTWDEGSTLWVTR